MQRLRSATLAAARIRLRITGVCLSIGWVCSVWALSFSNYYGIFGEEPPNNFGNTVTHNAVAAPGLYFVMLAILPSA